MSSQQSVFLHQCFSLNQERSFGKDLIIIPMCRTSVSITELGRPQTELHLEETRIEEVWGSPKAVKL